MNTKQDHENERQRADNLLTDVFSSLPKFSEELVFIPVELEGCQVYIPVTNYAPEDQSTFVSAVQEVYQLTKYWNKEESYE